MELRTGMSREGYKLDTPQASMSTAEAVSVYVQSAMTSYYYEDKGIALDRLVQNMLGTIAKENDKDLSVLKAYFSKVVKERSKEEGIWKDYYEEKNGSGSATSGAGCYRVTIPL